jgi:methyl-accepting chemotaxis protein
MIRSTILFLKKHNTTGQKKNIGIAVRLTAAAVGMLLFLGIIIITFSAINMGQCTRDREKESLRNTAFTLKNAYYVLCRGDFRQLINQVEMDNNIAQGSDESTDSTAASSAKDSVDAVSSSTVDAVSSATTANINVMTIIDTLHDETGIEVSIFKGDTRIATSIRDEAGLRKSGTKIGDEAKKQVIDQGEEYFSKELYIEGQKHYAYYIPIVSNNEVLGALGVAKRRDVIDRTVTETVIKLLVIELIITVVTITALFIIMRRISKYIHQTSEALKVIADGDLTIELNQKLLLRRDEIGQLAEAMIRLRDEIKDMLIDIKHSIDTLSVFADEIDTSTNKTMLTVDDVTKAMEDISRGASAQAEDTQNANFSVIEVGNEISNITDAVNVLKSRAEDINKASQQADVIADALEKSANNTMNAIDQIATQTEATNVAAEEIKNALNVITDIAKRTNLLSLNASIEASRAGENGKGFGVVASEIKSLANQSGISAKEIEASLNKLLEESHKSLEVVGRVKEIIKDQKSKLDDTRKQFEVVSDGVEESVSSIESIYNKIMILDGHRDTLIGTIESLSAISEENAAGTEETTASAVELNDTIGAIAKKASELRNMSYELKKSIRIFKLSETTQNDSE